MKKSKVTRSLLATCSIVALSVVLSGCLHSSDDTAATTPTEPPPTTEPVPVDVTMSCGAWGWRSRPLWLRCSMSLATPTR